MNQEVQNSMSNVINEGHVPRKLALLFMSEKGGVGKSTLAVSCVEYLRYFKGHPTLVVDADLTVRSIVNRYGRHDENGFLLENEFQLDEGVVHVQSSTQEGFKPIMQSLKHEAAAYAVIDFAAADITTFRDCFPNDESLEFQFKRRGYEVVVVIPFDDQAGQAQSVGDVIGALGPNVNYVLVQVPKSNDTMKMLNKQFSELMKKHGHQVFRLGSAYMNGSLRTYLTTHTSLKLHEVAEFALASGEGQSIFDESGDDGVDEWARHYMKEMHAMWERFFTGFAEHKSGQLSLPPVDASPAKKKSVKGSGKGESK
jgi:hypothetical protein